MASLSIDDFMARLEELDEGIQAKVQSAQANNAQLRYAATVSEGGQAISVGIIEADVATNPLAGLRGTGNMVSGSPLLTWRKRETK